MRISWIFASAVLTLSACGGQDEAEEENQVEAQALTKAQAKARKAARAEAKAKAEAAAEEAKVPPPTTAIALHLSATGQVDEALDMLKGLLKTAPEEAKTWEALSRIGIAHGRQATLLAEFDAAAAIGGQTELHHHLRADLAVAANDFDQVLLAANHLSEADDIAYFKAVAHNGMPESTINIEVLDAEKPGDALLLALVEKNAWKRKKILKDLELKTPQARLLLAQTAQDNGLQDKATQIFTELAQGEPQAATTYTAQLFLWGQAKDTASKAQHSVALVRSAFAAGDSAKGFANLSQAIEDVKDNQNPLQAFNLSKEIFDLLANANPEILQQATAFYARASLDHGLAELALNTAKTWAATCKTTKTETQGEGEEAKEVEIIEWDQACLAEPAWIQGISAFHLGLDEEIAAATEGLENAPPVFAGLVSLLKGDPKAAEAVIPGNAANDQITLLLAKARAQSAQNKSPIATLRQAVKVADKSGFNPDRVGTRLHLANALFDREENTDLNKLLKKLDSMANSWGDQGAALKAETHARRIMAGLPSVGANDTLPGSVAFSALAENAEVPEKADNEHRLMKWARARAAMAKGEDAKAIVAYADAAYATPPIFQGPWTNLSVLNGRSGPGIEQDIKGILSRGGADTGILALPLHDWWHEKEMMDSAFAIGDDPSVALDIEQRTTLNAAHVTLQARSVQWLAGGEETPEAAEAALDLALATAAENKSYARGLPSKPMDYSTIPSQLQSKAILSYRMGSKTGEAIVVTQSSSRIARLDSVKRVRSHAEKLRTLLRNGEAHSKSPGLIPGKSATMPLAMSGDSLRTDLLDIFTPELAGVGIYLLLVDADLYGFSFSIFPEQKDAARFVADIRSMSVNHTSTQGLRKPNRGKLNYGTDILALSPFRPAPDPKVGTLVVPGEAKNAARLFRQGVLVSKEGDQATAQLLTDTVDDARFVHISDFKTGERGGLALANGSLSLADLRGKDVGANVTVLSANEEPRVLIRQAHALFASGANNVLLSDRLIDEHVRGRFVYNFYEAIGRERPPVMALSEARKTLTSDSAFNGYFDPSWWGQFILYGNP